MNKGHLDIPKFEMDRVAYVPYIQMKLHEHYRDKIDGGFGGKLLENLEADSRVQALNGSNLIVGNIASPFDVRTLAMWLLWAHNEYGTESAELKLNKFLDSENIPVIYAIWVLGIELEEPIELSNEIRIVSINDMPDSLHKEQYLRMDFGAAPHVSSKPRAAITYSCERAKSYPGDECFKTSNNDDDHFFDTSQTLSDIALLLNIVEGVSCLPYSSAAYTSPETPIGLFRFSGISSPTFDVFGAGSSRLRASSSIDINKLVHAFNALPPESKIRMRKVLSRLMQAKRREKIEDKILDLGIALEMALDDNGNTEQLSLRFRLRGSWLVADNYEDRQSVYNQLKKFYGFRSEVAHTGALKGSGTNVARDQFVSYCSLAEKIIRKIICTPKLDWDALTLGGSN
jgi:hypothetical protein